MADLQPLFVGLVDDAGLFPPTALSMPDALTRHAQDEQVGSDILTGRFLVPASRVEELLDILGEQRLEVGLILDQPLTSLDDAVRLLAGDERTTLTGVELRLGRSLDKAPADAVQRVHEAVAALPRTVSVFVEVSLDDELPEVLAELATAGLGAKVRCGGVEASAFPAPEDLAAFVEGAVREDLPFKATAGLHHAMRYVDERTGFQHYGVLGILVAALRAVEGHPHDRIVDALTTDDADALAREVTRAGDDLEQQAREHFVAYGSCNTRAPQRDLHDLGLA